VLALLMAFALTRAPLTAEPTPPVWSVWPAAGTVTSRYGDDSGRWHPGIDIGLLRSLEVRAALPGRVAAVGQPTGFEGYGNIVEVVAGAGYTALYAHLASWRVHVGDAVGVGEAIATAGCTGSCSGTHLHFELRRRGRAVNPMRFHLR
jgi:murein DD-endopeptidase MepM/ murein hydrolase activator NlpD